MWRVCVIAAATAATARRLYVIIITEYYLGVGHYNIMRTYVISVRRSYIIYIEKNKFNYIYGSQ